MHPQTSSTKINIPSAKEIIKNIRMIGYNLTEGQVNRALGRMRTKKRKRSVTFDISDIAYVGHKAGIPESLHGTASGSNSFGRQLVNFMAERGLIRKARTRKAAGDPSRVRWVWTGGEE